MHLAKRRMINDMIEKAICEAINSVGMENPDVAVVLRRFRNTIAREAGPRITEDIGRARRLVQLCRLKNPR